MSKTIAKYGWIVVGIYFIYAAFGLAFYPGIYPLMPYGIIFGLVGAALIAYLLFLLAKEKKNGKSAGLTFIHMVKKYKFLIEIYMN